MLTSSSKRHGEMPPRAPSKGRQRRTRVPIRDLIGPVPDLGRSACFALFAALLFESCQLALPLLFRVVIDSSISTADRSAILPVALAFVGLATVHAILTAARGSALLAFSHRLNSGWLSNLFTTLSSLPITFFSARPISQIAAKFWSVSYIQRVVTGGFLDGLLDGMMALFMTALMFYLSPALASIAVCFIASVVAVRHFTLKRQFEANEVRADLSVVQQSHLWDTIAGIQSVKLACAEEARKGAWLSVVGAMLHADRRFQQSAVTERGWTTLLMSLQRICIISAGAHFVLVGQMSFGVLVAFVAYNELLFARASALTEKVSELRLLDGHRQKVEELVHVHGESPSQRGRCRIPYLEPSIELDRVSITYTGSPTPVLMDLSISIKAGECVVIIGPSGSGKTTILKAMLGLVPIDEGSIRIGNTDLSDVELASYYRLAGALFREDKVFTGTLAENISMAPDDHDQAWIEACARAVDLHHEIMRMPSGYSTVVKDDGCALSAGQRQRLLLARALYKRPRLLVLDEATSHVDAERERLILDHVSNMRATRVIVTHSTAPLRIADTVYRYSEGTCVRVDPATETPLHSTG